MRFLSHLSLAVALATAGAVTVTALPQTAYAQKKPKFSKEFQKQAGPVQAAIEGEDPAAAKPMVEGLLAQGWTGYDQFVAGQFAVSLGGKLKDQGLQEMGLKAMLASGFTPAEQVGVYNFFVGNFAYEGQRFDEARQYFQTSYDAGYRENNIGILLAETYIKQNRYQEGLAKWQAVIDDTTSAGQKAPEDWYRMARDRALRSNDKALYGQWAINWAMAYPSGLSWGDAVAATRRGMQGDSVQNLEVLRFMFASNSLNSANDYKEYAEEAQRKNLFGDIVKVLEKGRADGTIEAGNPMIAEYLTPARSKVAEDKASLPAQPSDVRGSGSASVMMNFADVWLGYGDYAKAAAFYEAGLARPGADQNRGNIGIGNAMAMAGDHAAAKAAFAKVSGNRQSLARLWQIWIDQQAQQAAPAAG